MGKEGAGDLMEEERQEVEGGEYLVVFTKLYEWMNDIYKWLIFFTIILENKW